MPEVAFHDGGVRAWAGLLLVVLAASLARTLPAWDHVFVGERGIRLLGSDAYYHLRHAGHMRTDGALRRDDVWTHYPTGQRATTPGLFAVAVAALPNAALPFVPPALGALALLALFVLLRRLAGSGAALLGVACLALYPGQFLSRSLLGFLDHHAAEVLLSLLSVLGFLRCLDRAESDAPPKWWRPAFLEALPMAVFLFTWSGAPVHLLLLALSVAVLAIVRLAIHGDSGWLPEACARFGFGLVPLVAIPAWIAPWLVMRPDLFAAVLAGCAAFACAAAPVLWAVRRYGRPRLAAALLMIAMAAVLVAGANTSAGALLLRTRTRLVSEHLTITPASVFVDYGTMLVLAVGGLAAAGVCVRRDRGRRVFGTTYALLVVALWWKTRDFAYMAGPFLALLAGFAWLPTLRLLQRPRRATVAGVVTLALLAGPIWPLGLSPRPWPSRSYVDRIVVCTDAWAEAVSWLRTKTPPPTIDADKPVAPFGDFAYPTGTYGVWSAWDYANLVNAFGRRPVVWSQGAARHPVQWMLERDENEALSLLQQSCRGPERVRYVMLDANTMGDNYLAHLTAAGHDIAALGRGLVDRPVGQATFGERLDNTVAARLYFRDGDGLRRFRLVYATTQRTFVGYVAQTRGAGAVIRRCAIPADGFDTRMRLEMIAQRGGVTEVKDVGYVYGGVVEQTIKVFECVEGARVQGRTRARAVVTAGLDLIDAANSRRHYTQETRAGADGRFSMRIPYATDARAGSVRARGKLALVARVSERSVIARSAVRITEQQVQSGGMVEVDLLPTQAPPTPPTPIPPPKGDG